MSTITVCIACGGSGSRMGMLTKAVNKHLLPVANKPMICWAIEKAVNANLHNIVLISDYEQLMSFNKLLGSGKEFGCNLNYVTQAAPKGVADALRQAKQYVKGEQILFMLADNIYEDNLQSAINTAKQAPEFAYIFTKEVDDPRPFGCLEFNEDKTIKRIIEKPIDPPSRVITIGAYLYPYSVFNIISDLTPSARGEYEITDVNNVYLEKGLLKEIPISGFWCDAGTCENLALATQLAYKYLVKE